MGTESINENILAEEVYFVCLVLLQRGVSPGSTVSVGVAGPEQAESRDTVVLVGALLPTSFGP